MPLPDDPVLGWEPDPDIGELAAELDQSPELYRALRPEALATLTYLAGLVRNISDAATPLQVTSAVRDRSYQDLLVQSNPEATERVLAAHDRLGLRHPPRVRVEDARRARSSSSSTACARSALLDYAIEPGAIHVTVSEPGAELLGEAVIRS